MNIILAKGLDCAVFGASINEIKKVFGNPNKKWFDDFGCLHYAYYNLKIILKFEKEIDMKLGWIVVQNNTCTLDNENIWNLSKEKIITKYSKLLQTVCEIDDFDSSEYIHFDKYWLEFQFTLGSLVSINFGVLFDKTDQPIFPG